MASLVFEEGPNAGRRYRLSDGDYIIGRRSDCQIFVPDMRVSRQHARIRKEGVSWSIEDLGSNNGTYVNGQRVQSGILRDQDEIVIAGNRIKVDMPDTRTNMRAVADSTVTVVDMPISEYVVSPLNIGLAEPQKIQTASDMNARLAEAQRRERLIERKLSAVSAILEIAGRSVDAGQLLDQLCERLLDVFAGADSVGVLVEDAQTKELTVKNHITRTKTSSEEVRVPGTIIQHVSQDGKGILLQDAALAGTTSANENMPPSGNRMGAPLLAHGHHFGVIFAQGTSEPFHKEDVDLLASIATQAALAMHAARMQTALLQRQRLEQDLRVARQIQRSLLPASPPDVVGMEFGVHYEPAYEIGGDFYDFIWHDKTHLAVLVGDVSGKAISAALYMARLSSELRSRAGLARTPSRLLRKVNEEMLALGDEGMFSTLIYMVYDLETRTLVFTNAGHVTPLLRRDGRVYPLHAERAHVPPIGVLPDMEIGEARVQLHIGDLIVLTTDGIHEARDAQGVEYGLKRLSRRIRTTRGSPEEVVKSILQDVDSHVASGSQGDDITILAISIGNQRARRRTDTLPGVQPDTMPPPGLAT